MKAEVDLLHRDVDNYKAKLQREKKSRECPCRNKVVECKEVQCSMESATLTNGQKDVSEHQHPNVFNLDTDLQVYYVKTVPVKYKEANLKIMALEDKIKKNQKKSDWYKELALSRRADVKRLEAELAQRTAAPTPDSSNASADTKSE